MAIAREETDIGWKEEAAEREQAAIEKEEAAIKKEEAAF